MYKKKKHLLIILLGSFFLFNFQQSAGTEDEYSREEKIFLLKLARKTLEDKINKNISNHCNGTSVPEKLLEQRATFVTLNKKDTGLRGCIGSLVPSETLYQNIINNTINAAVNDPRFTPVKPEELKDICIEISVLTVPKKLEFSKPEELIEKLRPTIDGVILVTRYGNSTYLPQVWKQIPQPEMFLSYLCKKHGAPAEAWKLKDTQVYTYQAIHFSEEELGLR